MFAILSALKLFVLVMTVIAGISIPGYFGIKIGRRLNVRYHKTSRDKALVLVGLMLALVLALCLIVTGFKQPGTAWQALCAGFALACLTSVALFQIK